jgi:hypothetical protein
MIDIPRLEKRLELFQWKLMLDPTVDELRKSLAALAAACEEVKTSKRLPVLLKVRPGFSSAYEVLIWDLKLALWCHGSTRLCWPLDRCSTGIPTCSTPMASVSSRS